MAFVAPAAEVIVTILSSISSLLAPISEDNPKRERFTQDFVKKSKGGLS